MSFVVQPYEQFVDDLLTALTGGVTRESHPFVGGEASYRLALPGAEPFTLRVFGQRNEQFAVFERGIDFEFDESEESISWKDTARNRPDDGSTFYVNYYRRDRDARLTDRNPGSVNATVAEAFARTYATVHQQMRLVYESGFVDLAQGTALDQLAALLALARKDARFASGEVLFKRSTPAPGDITIEAGTVVSTDRGINFETSDRRTLRRGQLAITVPVRAVVEGAAGRVEAGALRSINRPIFGIETVSNEAPTFFAAEKESDEEFRRRIKGTIARAGKSTLDAIKFTLIEQVPGVNDSNVQVTERPEAPGMVEVKLGLESTSDPELVARVEAAIFASRPAGVRVSHNLPRVALTAAQPGSVPASSTSATLGIVTGTATHLPADVLDRAPAGVLPLRAEIYLRLADPALAITQKERIENDARERVTSFVAAIPMGADVIWARLLARALDAAEVADAVLQVGAADPPDSALYTSNLATDGRKATIDPARVLVRLMEEGVRIDVLVTVEPAPGTAASARVDAAHRQAVLDAVSRVLAGTRDTLLRGALRDEIASALAGVQPTLQLSASSPLVISAEFEETGRLLSNTEAVTLETHQRAVVGDVRVELAGPLTA